MKALRFRAHVAGACALMGLAVWLSSGTMTPVASTFFNPIVSVPCGYLYNVDHPHHEATFRMLDGQPPERWRFSVVLRRLLFPLLAYPFMKVAGFEVGGFVASLLCQMAALVGLALFLRARYGEDAAITGAWLLATYPGITYWAALPYSYVAIVPASIGLFVLLSKLEQEPGVRRAAALCGAMGVLFTAYDLLPFFGVAAVLLLVLRRRLRELPGAVAGLLAAPLLSMLILRRVVQVDWTNKNTAIYGIVARSYLHPPALRVWLDGLSDFFPVLVANFFHSNLVVLPALFLAVVIIARARLTASEGALLVAGALVFLFNNLAPPYVARWQMRGLFIPRLYQPLFVALLVYCARVVAAPAMPTGKARLLRAVAVMAFAANATIAFGPIARVPWAGDAYHHFYMHSAPGVMEEQLARYGRRPLGFCQAPP
jgi:hypothetical protein